MPSLECQLLNDLPKYSRWPHRMLGLEEFATIKKLPAEVFREYETDKWGGLLKILKNESSSFSLENVNTLFFKDQGDLLCLGAGGLEVKSPKDAHLNHVQIIQDALLSYDLTSISTVVELGAGYGAVILQVALNQFFHSTKFIACEYTKSGVELIERIANAEGRDLEVGWCDFNKVPMLDQVIQPNALIYTSLAAHYVPQLPRSFIDQLIQLKPRAVIHLEPIYEFCDDETLLGILQKRYIEVNDYNKNLLSLLYEYEKNGKIRIMNVRQSVFGENPLLVGSVLVWEPI